MSPIKNRADRRAKTNTKLQKRVCLLKKIGMQSGTLYAKQRKKIEKSYGYFRDGHISHFVLTKKPKKTNRRNRYGKTYTPPKKDQIKIDKLYFEDN